jgi:hypothetical protein
MNQAQFVDELMGFLFAQDYDYLNDEDYEQLDEECSYELALGMIKEKYGALKKVNEPELFPVNDSRRASLRETQAQQASMRQGQL